MVAEKEGLFLLNNGTHVFKSSLRCFIYLIVQSQPALQSTLFFLIPTSKHEKEVMEAEK